MEGAVADKRLRDRVALVTGGSRGIGAAIAGRLAEDGAKVVVNYLQSEGGARRVVEAIEAAGGQAVALRGDVSRVESASALVAETVKRFGSLDVLVNNAAIAKPAMLDQVTESIFDEHFAANVKSALFMSQAAARVFKAGAVIVNISSLNTRYPGIPTLIYSATKAALESLTVSLSRELGTRGIRVVALAPGQIDTDMLRANNSPEKLKAGIERIALGRTRQDGRDSRCRVLSRLSGRELDHRRDGTRQWRTESVTFLSGLCRFRTARVLEKHRLLRSRGLV
jgi:3-oxoacyl-[acyl-carrier protein] reductase